MRPERPILKTIDYLLANVNADFSDVGENPDGSFYATADTPTDFDLFKQSGAVVDIAVVETTDNGGVKFAFRLPANGKIKPLPVADTETDFVVTLWTETRTKDAKGIKLVEPRLFWLWRVTVAGEDVRAFVGSGMEKNFADACNAAREAMRQHRNGGAK